MLVKRISSNFLKCRQFSAISFLRNAAHTPTTGKSNVKLEETIPGFRAPGAVATDYEIATGLERYELLKGLKGEDPWEDLHPIEITALGTTKKPIEVKGTDVERYIGCTGFPADSHPPIFLTLRDYGGKHFDRCPDCGNVFKVTRL
ncbi:Cytochrome c oxidase subunit 4 [Boothiomyces macroporosus]|uniref:Cytochrome c oxidase subunit 4 n=1 Tax=Boothiomyces macroporosus TaxID=261099 RepID=A0AAD5Y2F8_9FUNG|nr:Cytochrome c oxidase subunit 4 [Boothiomyces macroporosus]